MSAVLESRRSPPAAVPLLENGDHLDQKTFHERHEAMPEGFNAELIGGIVYVASPAKVRHGRSQSLIVTWLGVYEAATPGTEGYNNTTLILDDEHEPQPDAGLTIAAECGGQTEVNEDDYLVGPPELVIEVASSSESIDLHRKRATYEQAGVLEYAVVLARPRQVRWFAREGERFIDVPSDERGVFCSRVFPGLWLDSAALFEPRADRLLATLQQGLATPEHAAFAADLAGRRREP